jgi:hypothetical protein
VSSNLWIPKHLKKGRKFVSVCFYRHLKSGRLLVGFPENFPAPNGFEKIVCRSAAEVDAMSARLRDQERRDEQMSEEQREVFEGPLREMIRKELVTRMMNARNDINREFCRFAIQKIDEETRRRKMKTETFMHCEAAEDGH